MSFFSSKPTKRTTSFAEFISSAPSKEKKRVYADVLKKTSDSQKSVLIKAKSVASA